METKTSVIWGATYLRVLPIIAAMAISAPVPAGATNVSSPSAVYNPDRDSIEVFVIGDDGNLYDNYWDGSAWQWAPLGAPAGHTVSSPNAVYHPTFQSMFVFVIGDDGHLYVWNGVARAWEDKGVPSDLPNPASSVSSPSAVHRHSGGVDQIAVFVKGDNARLYARYLSGTTWGAWEDDTVVDFFTGQVFLVSSLSAVYLYNTDRLFVTYTTPDGGLCNHIQIRCQGFPGFPAFSSISAVYQPSLDVGAEKDVAFVTGDDGQLYDLYSSDGYHWSVEPQGMPGTTVSSPSAVYEWLLSRLAVFVIGGDGQLYDKYWDGFGWVWEAQQTPPGGAGIVAPLSVIYQYGVDGNLNRPHVFVAGTDGHLYDKYWSGGWIWQDQGQPQ
jgi:hypothetical protein